MKKILLSLVALVCATVSFAQGQIATLSQNETIKTFYGPAAFANAMKAAKHGDVITLSNGTFSQATIDKAVILRGTGMLDVADSLDFFAPTIIEGATINIVDSISQHLEVEGIKFINGVTCNSTLTNAVFKKCNFYSIETTDEADCRLENMVLLNCRVRNKFLMRGTVSCINSILHNPLVHEQTIINTFEFINCVIQYCQVTKLSYSRFGNCFIYNSYSNALPSTCVVNNCVSNTRYTFDYSNNLSNKECSPSYFFSSGSYLPNNNSSSEISDSYKYTLTETAAKTYLGDDGTQVGIYGGNLPYEEKVAIPRITKCIVAGKSTRDGKLSVDIKVDAE